MAVDLREGGGKEGRPIKEARGGAAPTAKPAQPARPERKCSVQESARKHAGDGDAARDSAGGNATGMATSYQLAAAPSTSRREEEEVVPSPTPAAALSAGPVATAAEEKQEEAPVCDGSVSRGSEHLHRQLPRAVGGP